MAPELDIEFCDRQQFVLLLVNKAGKQQPAYLVLQERSVHPTQQQERTTRHGYAGQGNAERKFETQRHILLSDSNGLGREYLAKDPLDLGAHVGDTGHDDGDARCFPRGRGGCKLVLHPEGTGGDLIPFIDSFDEQGRLRREDFAGFDDLDVIAPLAKSFDQLLLRGSDAIEAGQHQPGRCLNLARDHSFLQHERELGSAQPLLFAACALKAARPLAKALDIRAA